MIALAIQLLWLLIGIIILCAVVWLVIYGVTNVAGVPIPDRIIQAVWFVVAVLIVIAILTILAGGSIGGYSLHMR
jgi:hypothetical protein